MRDVLGRLSSSVVVVGFGLDRAVQDWAINAAESVSYAVAVGCCS